MSETSLNPFPSASPTAPGERPPSGPRGFRHTEKRTFKVLLAGMPNTGKTTLFNALTGLRAKTANFPGTTVEKKVGHFAADRLEVELVDLPGMYHLDPSTLDEQKAVEALRSEGGDLILLVADAVHLERSLFLAEQLRHLPVPLLIALNRMDEARRLGLSISSEVIGMELGRPVVPISALSGEGIEALCTELHRLLQAPAPQPVRSTVPSCSACPIASRFAWCEGLCAQSVVKSAPEREQRTDALDRWITHPVLGWALFIAAMLGLLAAVFQLAAVPTTLIESAFGRLGDWATGALPEGLFHSFVVDGVLAGVGGVLVFLPQIFLLFFLLSLLEDSGYLARAAMMLDRTMQRIGLPGISFVPLLSAHACAVPAIMATRVIEDHRDRLLTILVAPLASCSARLPVYVMIAAILFPDRPLASATLFIGSYLVGIAAIAFSAAVLRKLLIRGKSRPLIIELPDYRRPNVRLALRSAWDRGLLFLRNAGTVILVLSMLMWVLATFPRMPDGGDAHEQLAHSIAGRVGHVIEPVIRPLGYDWQIGIGLISAMAAREVIVSTLSIIYRIEAEEDSPAFYETLRKATRPDGTPVFTPATSASLLVFFILALQCLPTMAIARRETGSWKWPLFQFAYMGTLAYACAWATYTLVSRM